MPTVSVIMSVKDGEPYLRSAVDSILNQALRDFEFIIIDDGSTDGTKRILDSYEDERIVRLENPKTLGLTKSLNRGFGVACGKFIARQDADDLSYPMRLEKQVAYLEKNEKIGLLGSAYQAIDANGSPLHVSRQPMGDYEIRWQMLFWNAFCHTSVMVRRTCLNGGNPMTYDDSLSCAQDYDLWARVLERTQGGNLQEPLVELRLHDKSITVQHSERQRQIADRVSYKQVSRFTIDDQLSKAENSRLRTFYYGLPEDCSPQDLKLARRYLDILARFVRAVPESSEFAKRQKQNWVDRLLNASKALGKGSTLTLAIRLALQTPQNLVWYFGRRLLNMGQQPSKSGLRD